MLIGFENFVASIAIYQPKTINYVYYCALF